VKKSMNLTDLNPVVLVLLDLYQKVLKETLF
jgi:hypothetical protein